MNEVQQFQPSNPMPISLSEAALFHIKARVRKQAGAIGLRFSVKKAGCSGYKYVTDIVNESSTDDLIFSIDNELTIYIKRDSFILLEGLHIDYVEKDLGLKRLVFINPNEKSQCGCGESFLV